MEGAEGSKMNQYLNIRNKLIRQEAILKKIMRQELAQQPETALQGSCNLQLNLKGIVAQKQC